jgi:hypothetical protein
MVRPMLIVALGWLFPVQAPCFAESGDPVSYGREIAPILALYCHACHASEEPTSGFQVTTYKALMRGGIVGKDIVPGDPERSTLVEFIEGKRGPAQRMPQGSAPLSVDQIALIKDWIRQGAVNDHAPQTCYQFDAATVEFSDAGRLEISCRIPSSALLRVSITEQHTRRLLHIAEGSIKLPSERANIAAPGEWIHWSIGREQNWPQRVNVELEVRYPSESMDGAVLAVKEKRGEVRTTSVRRLTCLPE